MSEHRRKQPPSRGRRAAAPSGRRAGPPPPPPSEGATRSEGGPGATAERPYGSRAEARRAAQRSGRRRGKPEVRKKRFIDYPRSGYTGLRRWVPSWRQVLGSALTFFLMLIGLVGVAYAMIDIPPANALAQVQSNTYYWADGSEMTVTRPSDTNITRQSLAPEEIPQDTKDAVVAVENESFWTDRGIDPIGIGRAMLNMARGGDVQSGSTITQQYVKNFYLNSDQTLSRKFRELLLSVKVSAEQSKEEILAGYINSACWGRGACGIQAASHAYFDKEPEELTISENAFLAGLLKGPYLYDPFDENGNTDEERQERATNRWLTAMQRLLDGGVVDQAEYDEIIEAGFPEVVEFQPGAGQEGQIGYLVNLANHYIISSTEETANPVTQEDLDKGGYSIWTTFDKTMMEQMEEAVQTTIENNLDPENRPEDRYVQFGGAAVEPGDGAIRAIYGGEDYLEHYLNNADSPNVQVGSTFKPFVLAAAFRDGIRDPDKGPDQGPEDRTRLSPDSVYRSENHLPIVTYDGEPAMVEDAETGEDVQWEQENFEGGDQGDITLRQATNVSANSPFVQLGMDIGTQTVAQAAVDAGVLESSLGTVNDTVPTFALGVSTPGPIRMASAYSTFAASGEQNDPYSVTRVEQGGNTVLEHEGDPEQAFSSDVADTVTDMLTGVIQEGSGMGAKDIGFPIAGKTGTTDDNRSAWFIGYSSELSTAIGMWRQADSEEDIVEGDDVQPNEFLPMYGTAGKDKINGGSLPLETWKRFMSAASNGEEEDFPEAPDDLGEVVWDDQAESPTPEITEEEEEDPTEEPTQEETQEERPTQDPTQEEPTEEPTDDQTTPSGNETCGGWVNPCSDDGGGSEGDTEGDTEGSEGTSEGDTSGEETDEGASEGADAGEGDSNTIW
ncbi:transglycosylase domain-containing protein [Streptomyces sp. RFCAC02]|uniref:transglycosylase domain-containing protein n=1 Tax=Streptomyces sp. RFCAC02 TaxID=2499143 RepID=UPI00143DACC2|nr:transglycosylase domain-containing protein [Streptomyces sp. RFCAC02]